MGEYLEYKRDEEFMERLQEAANEVKTWPEWEQKIWSSGVIKLEDQPNE